MAVSGTPFLPPVSASVYPHLSLLLVSTGLLFLGWFFTLQVTSSRSKASSDPSQSGKLSGLISRIVKEAIIALVASSLLGFGLLFLCLNVGIYV